MKDEQKECDLVSCSSGSRLYPKIQGSGKTRKFPWLSGTKRKQRNLLEAVQSCLAIVVHGVVVIRSVDQAKVVTAVAAVGVVAAVAVYFFKSRKSQKKSEAPKGSFLMCICSP